MCSISFTPPNFLILECLRQQSCREDFSFPNSKRKYEIYFSVNSNVNGLITNIDRFLGIIFAHKAMYVYVHSSKTSDLTTSYPLLASRVFEKGRAVDGLYIPISCKLSTVYSTVLHQNTDCYQT